MSRCGRVVRRLVGKGEPGGSQYAVGGEGVEEAANRSISARITSMTSSGRRAMCLWPRSMVMPGCCCWRSRGAVSEAERWLISWRECSKAAFARATTSLSEMGVGASLLIASSHRAGRAIGRLGKVASDMFFVAYVLDLLSPPLGSSGTAKLPANPVQASTSSPQHHHGKQLRSSTMGHLLQL